MDYEKAYKEALEKARKRYEYAKKEDNPIWCSYEELFPELAESEDERIRKEIIEYLKGNLAPGKNLINFWIKWLEKQNDPITSNPNYNKDKLELYQKTMFDIATILSKYEDKDNSPLEQIRSLVIQCSISGIEKQKEQKPAEWSKDYREEDLRTRFAFYTYKDEDDTLYLSNLFVEETSRNKGFGTKILAAAEKVAEIIGASRICLRVKQNSPVNEWYRKNGYGYMTFEDGYDWLEKNLEYLKPKQEWSEEDLLNLYDIIYAVGKVYKNNDEYKKNLTSWLKSLSLKKRLDDVDKLCSNEWSEEDEAILGFIQDAVDKFDFDSIKTYYAVSDWLKSLRPHWKPSEEQMQALEECLLCDKPSMSAKSIARQWINKVRKN